MHTYSYGNARMPAAAAVANGGGAAMRARRLAAAAAAAAAASPATRTAVVARATQSATEHQQHQQPELADGAWMVDVARLPATKFVSDALACVQVDGKGRGLRATRDAAAGELLLLVPPLVALTGPPGPDGPTPSDLVDAMLVAPSPPTAAVENGSSSDAAAAAAAPVTPAVDSPWLSLLFDGSAASARAAVDIAAPLGGAAPSAAAAAEAPPAASGSKRALKKGGGAKAAGGGFAAGAGGSGAAGSAKRAAQQARRRAAKAVAFNAFADRHQDLALAALARQASAAAAAARGGGAGTTGAPVVEEADASIVGLWPEFAMLNHACAPSAINFPVHLATGKFMAVRAARPLAAGEEATISYVGADQLRPLRARRAALKEAFGFECGCARCAAEAALYEGGSRSVGATIEAVAEVSKHAPCAILAVGGDLL